MYSLKEIHEKMLALSENKDVYSQKWLRIKLKERYKDNIFFTEINGKANVVCFRNLAGFLLNDVWFSNRRIDSEEEAERIIAMSAKLIISGIRAKHYECDKYPSNGQIERIQTGLDWLPTYLRLFMELILKNPLKQISIGQAIVNAARPNSCISPIRFGVGVEMDHMFGSKII